MQAVQRAGAVPRLEKASGYQIIRFRSVGELVTFALSDMVRCRVAANESELTSYWERRSGSGWWNGYTVDSFLDELRAPSRKRLDAVNDLRDKIRLALPPRPGVSRRVRVGMPDGEELDPMAWLRRDPDGWAGLERVHRPSQSRLVRIACNVAAHCGEDQKHVLHRGAAVCALADALTSRGRSVEVVGHMSAFRSWCGGLDWVLEVVMKRGGDPLDLSMLSLCLAEIGFLRVVLLSALHRLAPQKVTYGLGQPMPLPTLVAAGFDTVSEFTIKSEADAVRYVSQETDARCGQETRR